MRTLTASTGPAQSSSDQPVPVPVAATTAFSRTPDTMGDSPVNPASVTMDSSCTNPDVEVNSSATYSGMEGDSSYTPAADFKMDSSCTNPDVKVNSSAKYSGMEGDSSYKPAADVKMDSSSTNPDAVVNSSATYPGLKVDSSSNPASVEDKSSSNALDAEVNVNSLPAFPGTEVDSSSQARTASSSATSRHVIVTFPSGRQCRLCPLLLRHPCFRTGVILLPMAFAIFIAGYSAGAWTDETGLWVFCSKRDCPRGIYMFTTTDWLDVVRATESLALICLVLSMVVEVYQDVCKPPPLTENKAVEILAFLSAAFCTTGLIVFAVKLPEFKEQYDRSGLSYDDPRRFRLSWGWLFATLACVFILIGAALIAFFRSRHVALLGSTMQIAGYPLLASQISGLENVQRRPRSR